MYSISDIPGDFVGANKIITNLTEETETGIKINLHRGVPRSFLVPITFKRILCRVHQDGGKTLINLTMYHYSIPYLVFGFIIKGKFIFFTASRYFVDLEPVNRSL